MAESVWIMRIMIMLIRAFQKQKTRHILPAAGQPSMLLCSESFKHATQFLEMQTLLWSSFIYAWKEDIIICWRLHFSPYLFIFLLDAILKVSAGPQSLSKICQALIGEPVILCVGALIFICIVICWWIQSPLLIRLTKATFKKAGQMEKWVMNLQIGSFRAILLYRIELDKTYRLKYQPFKNMKKP